MIRFSCSHCGKEVRTPVSAAGKTGRCPFCKTLQAIPHPFEVALAEGSASAGEVAMANGPEDMPAPAAVTEAPKKAYRQYTAADAGPQRKVSINLGKK